MIPRNLEKLFAARGRVLIPDANIVRGKKFSSILSNIFERLDGAGTKLGDWHKFFDDLLSRRNWTTQLWKEKSGVHVRKIDKVARMLLCHWFDRKVSDDKILTP